MSPARLILCLLSMVSSLPSLTPDRAAGPHAGYADAAAIRASVMARVFARKDNLPLDVWCDRHRVLAEEGTAAARTGQWDTDNTPYLREPLRRIQDPELREACFWKSAQVGYTEGVTINYTLHCIAERRRPAMIVYPTEAKGVQVNKNRLLPTVKACPLTAAMVRRAHDLTNKELRIGNVPIWFAYSKSSDSLRGDPVGDVLPDEIDAFDNSQNDTLSQCRSRQTTFRDRKLIYGSTPEDEHGVIRGYERSDVRWRFVVPCPFTGQFFELWSFEQLGWFGGLDAEPSAVAANTWVESPFAPEGETLRIREHFKRWMVRNGLWLTQNESIESDGSVLATLDRDTGGLLGLTPLIGSDPVNSYGQTVDDLGKLTGDFFRDEDQEPDDHKRSGGLDTGTAERIRAALGVRIAGPRDRGPNHGFRVNSLVSLLDGAGWGGTSAEFVRSGGNPGPTFWKERLGQVPAAASERVEIATLRALCIGRDQSNAGLQGHEHGEIPNWCVATFAGLDVQKACVKGQVWGFGPRMVDAALVASFRIERDHHKNLREPELRAALAAMAFPHLGTDRTARPLGWFIDSGHFTEEVYELVRHLRSVRTHAWACKGMDTGDAAKPVWTSTVTTRNLPDGTREARPDPIDLIGYNDHAMSGLLVSRLAAAAAGLDALFANALDRDTGELVDAEQALAELAQYGRTQLPGLGGWPDADAILDEMTNVHKVLIGRGSGKPGRDGLGRLREVWRKKTDHRANDYFDAAKLCFVGAKRFQVERWSKPELDARRAAAAAPRRERRAAGGMRLDA